MPGKYELKHSTNGQFMFHLKAANHEIILASQTYTSKEAARNGIESCKKNSGTDAHYDRRTAKNGQPYFVLLAANKQVIGNSEMYSSTSAMENGIRSCITNGPTAEVVDLTTK
ncbi:MAG TPA: YegP family protein [Anaeromyxobacter sp.]|nr:YegP family protein [Anaeromyxobacter sp.]